MGAKDLYDSRVHIPHKHSLQGTVYHTDLLL